MSADLGGIGRKLASLTARLKARRERDGTKTKETVQEKDQSNSKTATSNDEAIPLNMTASNDLPKESILEYVSATWTDDHSIADTESTITASKPLKKAIVLSSSVRPKGDPSMRRGSSVRADGNDAVQRIRSTLLSRHPSLYYMGNGTLGELKRRNRDPCQGHRYCCPDPEEILQATETTGETESTEMDWRLRARELGSDNAGSFSLTSFDEQHLADRLFFNGLLRKPAVHLAGSYKAAVQDLQAMYMEHAALRESTSKAVMNANYLEERARSLQSKVEFIQKEVAELKAILNAHNIKQPV